MGCTDHTKSHLVKFVSQNVIPVSALNDKEAEDIVVIDPEKDANHQVTQPQTQNHDKIHEEMVSAKVNSQIKRFGCGFCDTFFDSNTELVAHHKEQHKCEFCNFTYKTVRA